MPPPDPNAAESWTSLIEQLDACIVHAAIRFRDLHDISGRSFADADDSLRNELTSGEPDYQRAETVLAYAFQYLTRRALSLLGAILLLPHPAKIRRVLDIGSGSGATLLAFSLLRHLEDMSLGDLIVRAVDPCSRMQEFSREFLHKDHVCALSHTGISWKIENSSWNDIGTGQLEIADDYFDLVISSAALPFYQGCAGHLRWTSEQWRRNGAAVAASLSKGGHVVAIQPNVERKRLLLNQLVHWIQDAEPSLRLAAPKNSHSYNAHLTRSRVLTDLSRVYEDWTGRRRWTMKSWNEQLADEVRILYKPL